MLKLIKVIIIGSMIFSVSIFAFKPSVYGPWIGAVNVNHRTITRDGLTRFTVDGQARGFSPEATIEVMDGNSYVDLWHPNAAEAHCDAEHIGAERGCSKRLVDLKNEVVEILTSNTSPDIEVAREKLGQAYHTLQDFYSHSNWVNLDRTNIYRELTYNAPFLNAQDEYEGTRIDGDGDEEEILDIAGYETCLWDLESYDQQPWQEMKLGPRGLNVITTGWFEGAGAFDPPFFKCDHGFAAGSGLNKDTDSQRKHEEAVQVAILHTTDYAEQIINEVIASNTLTLEELNSNIDKFLGQLPYANIGFVIDTTGSMGDIIAGIKNATTHSVNKLKQEDKDISKFFLLSYGDPGIGEVLIASNPDEMLSNINTVTLRVPDDGGDSPELSLNALVKMLNTAEKNSIIYLYTDDKTKNTELTSTVISIANEKNIRINFLLSGNTDDAYSEIALGTQGDIHEYAHSVEGAEGTFVYIDPEFYGGVEKLTKISAKIPGQAKSEMTKSLSNGKSTGSTKTQLETKHNFKIATWRKPYINALKSDYEVQHLFVVDSVSTDIFVNFGMVSGGNVGLYRPDGSEVLYGDNNVTISSSNVGRSFNIASPPAGKWLVKISGDAGESYSLNVDAISEIRIIDLSFQSMRGRIAHEGFFPIDGLPLKTKEQIISLTMAGEMANISANIVMLDGTTFTPVNLDLLKADTLFSSYFGSVLLPEEAFRIVITGETAGGDKFERTFNKSFSAQNVSVERIDKKAVVFTPGSKYDIGFKVENTGDFDVFRLRAELQDGTILPLAKDGLSLTKNSIEDVRVKFTVPDSIENSKKFSVTLTAESITDTKSRNYAVFSAPLDRYDLDEDGMSDSSELMINDGNIDGIADFRQSNVVSFRTETGLNFTFELPDYAFFTHAFTGSLNNENINNIDISTAPGYFEFETKGLGNETTEEVKIFYKNKAYPSDYYTFNETEHQWVIDNTAILGNGHAIIKLKNGSHKGFFVYNNMAPKAFVSSQKTEENQSLIINLLENTHDEDGDIVKLNAFDPISSKGGAITNIEGDAGKIIYTPPNNYEGKDAFDFSITDNKGAFKSVRVIVDIIASNSNVVSATGNTSGGGSLGWFALILCITNLTLRRKFFRNIGAK